MFKLFQSMTYQLRVRPLTILQKMTPITLSDTQLLANSSDVEGEVFVTVT
ncbi:cadherin-like domain-containing protein [Vibrio chagasii]|nr:cadherin-like domain-containing protein [Vibrio chagasii]